ncbi:peroxisomal targeting signal 1 receptor [Lentinula edodes]|uniref:Peroxisomal targeting signal 1 receptor n=1 Tax=Lentinula edodes TaxID=5353 RepID=A0A1Q3EAP5_LENED|nr:peroxisomal targeting signal 1 receptor [Lentinula edodes]
MSLPMLVGGTECGPSNPLQGLSKHLDNDRGLQQDHFGAGRAGPSQETFRSQITSPPSFDQDTARFFAKSPPPQFYGNSPYDMAALRGSLPAADAQSFKQNVVADWAVDFLTQQPMQASSPQPLAAAATQSTVSSMHSSAASSTTQAVNMIRPAQVMPFGSTWNATMQFIPSANSFQAMTVPRSVLPDTQLSWYKEFDAQQSDSVPTEGLSNANAQEEAPQSFREQDELSRTAGLLLETVKTEKNPKFQNSIFMNLMTQLRDQKVVVRGNEMVENDGTHTVGQDSRVDVKGKGKASDSPFIPYAGLVSTLGQTIGNNATMAGVSPYNEQIDIQEDANDAYFRQENEDYTRYWNGMDPRKSQRQTVEVDLNWDKLQTDWEKFEASTKGITPVVSYQFQKNNPYLRGDSLRMRHHSMHSDDRLETVLALEAAVQQDMSNASAWFELGVKQQEHERETQALQALKRATELDPSYLPGWLALAVSYTNDGRRLEAYEAIRDILVPKKPRFKKNSSNWFTLAVLFNSNEEYGKAQDCFRAALSIRPDDWQLYNRVGATMANSGRAEEALEYYYRALDLNPAYVRARYNLGISCIQLKRYNEGALHILDALSLQDAEGVHDVEGFNDARGGITSNALWDSLKTACLHLQRVDLATLCDKRDVEAFRFNYQFR